MSIPIPSTTQLWGAGAPTLLILLPAMWICRKGQEKLFLLKENLDQNLLDTGSCLAGADTALPHLADRSISSKLQTAKIRPSPKLPPAGNPPFGPELPAALLTVPAVASSLLHNGGLTAD